MINNAVNWFSKNKMFINPNKFSSFDVQKNRVHNRPTYFVDGKSKVEIGSSVKLLRINIGKQLSFNQHVSNNCKSVSIQQYSDKIENPSRI